MTLYAYHYNYFYIKPTKKCIIRANFGYTNMKMVVYTYNVIIIITIAEFPKK